MKKWMIILACVLALALCLSGCALRTAAPKPADEAAVTPDESYKILFYPDVDSDVPSETAVQATYGVDTTIPTVEDLGFTKEGLLFEGWRIYREFDGKWFLRSEEGKGIWAELEDGKLPEGCHFSLRRDGGILTAPTPSGTVRMYAQWGGENYAVYFHLDENSPPLPKGQLLTYGVKTPLLSLEDLGIEQSGKSFLGWKLYREIDGKWRVKNSEGKASWGTLSNGAPKEGYTFSLFKDGQALTTAATSGIVHAYAQWG